MTLPYRRDITTKPTILKRDGGYYCTSYDLEGLKYSARAETIDEAYRRWCFVMATCRMTIGEYLFNKPKN